MEPVITHALRKISEEGYMETDIITVSDFEMRPVDYMLARSIEHAKAEPFQWKKEKFTKRKPHPFWGMASFFSQAAAIRTA